MAPTVKHIGNNASVEVMVFTPSGQAFKLDHGDNYGVAIDMSSNEFIKIRYTSGDEHYCYELKYNGNYNVNVNSEKGREKGVADDQLHVKWGDMYLDVRVETDSLVIHSTNGWRALGIYSDGTVNYYYSVYCIIDPNGWVRFMPKSGIEEGKEVKEGDRDVISLE